MLEWVGRDIFYYTHCYKYNFYFISPPFYGRANIFCFSVLSNEEEEFL